MKQIITYTLLFIVLFFQHAIAQQLLENTKLSLRLRDGIELNCYKPFSMNDNTKSSYYYLPTNIHFSTNPQGEKSHSLIVYKDENEQIKGAIMHWLLSWGLNKNQKEEASALLKVEVGNDANLIGAILAEKDQSKADFEIIGNNQLSKILNTAMVNRGNVPLIANSKIAIALKFTKDEAIHIHDLFTSSKEQKETNIQMKFLVSFKKPTGRTYQKNITISQNLKSLMIH